MEQIKNYLIVGASSEVGVAFIKSLANKVEAGVQIVAHYGSDAESLLQLKKSFQHIDIHPIQADLSQPAEVNKLLDETEAIGVPQCIIWLAAGKLEYRKLKKIERDKIQTDMEIQVYALAETGARFLPLMAKERFGKMVVMLSECTIGMPPRFMTEYVTVKYAALGLMKSMSLEYADKGVNVNGISPGMMETAFLSNIDERFVAMNAESNPQKRNAMVEEVAEAIHFLTGKGSDYMNGANLNVSGGNR